MHNRFEPETELVVVRSYPRSAQPEAMTADDVTGMEIVGGRFMEAAVDRACASRTAATDLQLVM